MSKTSRDYPKFLSTVLQSALRELDWLRAVGEFSDLLADAVLSGDELPLWLELLHELERQGVEWDDWLEHWPGGEAALERPVYFLTRGALALAIQAYERAGYFLFRAAEVAPESALPLAYLGMLHEAMGSPPDALAFYDGALDLAPHLFSVLNAAGNLCHELGFYVRAAAYYRRAVPLLLEPVNRAVVLNNLANSLRASGELQEAIEAYRAARALDPSQPAIALSLAEAMLEAKAPAQAQGYLADIVTTDGFDRWPDDARARCYTVLSRAAHAAGDYAAAVIYAWHRLDGKLTDDSAEGTDALLRSLYALLVEAPHALAAEVLLAHVSRRLGYLDAALLHAKRVTKSNQSYTLHFGELGAVLLLLGKEDVGLEALEEALALSPAEPTYHALRAIALWRTRPEMAAAALREAIQLEPHEARHRCDYAWLQMAAGDHCAARATQDEALLLWDEAPIWFAGHGPVLQRGYFADLLEGTAVESPEGHWFDTANYAYLCGKVDAARSLLQRGLARNPEHPEALFNYAWMTTQALGLAEAAGLWQRAFYHAEKDYAARFFAWRSRLAKEPAEKTQIIQEIEDALSQDPQDSLARLLLAKLLEPAQDAVQHFEHLVRVRGDLYSPWYWLGQAHFHRRELDLARPLLEKSVRLNPNFSQARSLLAQCYGQLGDGARKHVQNGTCYFLSGHLHRAREEYEAALDLDPNFEEARLALKQVKNRLRLLKEPEAFGLLDLLTPRSALWTVA